MLPQHKHTWLWTNFNTILSNLNRKSQFYRLKQYFINKKKPTIVFTGTGTDLIYNEDNTLEYFIFSNLSVKQLQSAKYQEIDVYFYEPLTFKFIEELREKKLCSNTQNFVCRYGFYEEFDKDSKYRDMTIIELDYLQDIAAKYNVNFKVYSCDYNLSILVADHYSHLYPNIICHCYDIFIRDTALNKGGVEHSYPIKDYSGENSTPNYVRGYEPKLYNKICSLNLRYATHRQLVAAHLSNKDAYLTWNYKIDSKLSTHKIGWIDKDILDCDLYDHLSQYNLKEKCNIISYRKDNPSISISDYLHVKSIMQDYIGYENDDLIEAVHHRFLYVVTESRFCQPISNISEKVLRSYIAKRPFVIVAPPYSLEYLNKLGFKSFNNWWDESYDTEENHTKRLKKIFDIIDYVDSLDYDDLYNLLTDMESVLTYNYEYIKSFKRTKIILQ